MRYKNKVLKEKIDNLNLKRLSLVNEIKNLDTELVILEQTYTKEEINYYFKIGLCSSCKEDLSLDDIKYNTIYCESCREADSVLDWNCKLE